MVNADRDKSEPPKWVECKSCDVSLIASGAGRPFWLRHNADHSHTIVYTREPGALSAPERPADAGTPTSAPAPSQAATEAHSDDRHDVTKCSDMRCAICLAFVRGAEIDELRAEVERLTLAGRLWAKRAEAAEAKVARVEALCDDWDRVFPNLYARALRAALAGPATEEPK